MLMNYDSIILEMLARIQTLEEKVAALEGEAARPNAAPEDKKITTGDIRDYIDTLRCEAAERGEDKLLLRAGDVHRALKLTSRMPQVCNAMRQCMRPGDEVLHETKSGYSSTLEILYNVGGEAE